MQEETRSVKLPVHYHISAIEVMKNKRHNNNERRKKKNCVGNKLSTGTHLTQFIPRKNLLRNRLPF